jgi:hypothetical protein
MKIKPILPFSVLKYLSCAILLFALATQGQDKPASASGTWTWSTPGRNGGPDRTTTLTLKAEGSKLTGKIAAPGRGGQAADTVISDGKVDGDTISFLLVREFNGNSNTNKYSGKITADKITGKIETTRNGETQSRDWEAKRATASP